MNEKIKEIEGFLFWYKKEISDGKIPSVAGKIYIDHVEYLLSKIMELEEGIKKHRDNYTANETIMSMLKRDNELYKLVETGGK